MSLVRRTLTVLAAAALAGSAVGAGSIAQATYEDPTMDLPRKTGKIPGVGPYRPYVQEIQINTVVPMKDQAIINRTEHGYLFRSGQQHNDTTLTYVGGRLRFADTNTASWKWLPKSCRKIEVARGIAASCAIGAKFTQAAPMLVEVWPRLGNDVLDSTALPALFDVSFLGDKGEEIARFGAGDDFFNGAQDNDRGYGGEGRDWIRTGLGTDFIDGEGGGDHLVGVHEADVIQGGEGDDRIEGGDANDQLYGGEGFDFVGCGAGFDKAWVAGSERANQCESVNRS